MQIKSPEIYINGVLDKNRVMLAKTITLIESSRSDHQDLAQNILDKLIPHSGNAVRLGITGVPGVGKSTFIESFGMYLIEKGHKVAVLAVDPSSSISGGSVLADKTRMEKLAVQKNAFIRPSPSGGSLGGVARRTRETTVASMADFFLVLMLAGAGDEFQGIKKGVLELADALTINKADGDNIKKAEMARREYKNAFHLLKPASSNWSPPVLTCSALENTGIDKIWETVMKHREIFTKSGELKEKRQRQSIHWMESLLEEGLKKRFFELPSVKNALPEIRREVERGETSPTLAAHRLLNLMKIMC